MNLDQNPIEIAKNALALLGWGEEASEDTLFQKELEFVARTNLIGYHAQFSSLTSGVLHFELAVELLNIPDIKRAEYLRLLNLINQDLAVGSLCHVIDDELNVEFLVHRAQLYFSPNALQEEMIARFVQDCVTAFDLCLPHISDFLAAKLKGVLGRSGEIEEVYLQMSPEEVVNMILSNHNRGTA